MSPTSRDEGPITFAHRGARAYEPENTIPAFRRALDLGASGLETDARVSADGQAVLVHDAVARLGRRRRRADQASAAELESLGVPRLVDVYAELGTGFDLSVDLQVPGVAGPVVEAATAAGGGALSRLWLCSPDLELLRDLHALRTPRAQAAPEGPRLVHSVRRRALGRPLERHAADLASIGLDAMNFHHTEWTAGLVSLFHRFGVLAFAWDAQETRHLTAVLAMGVDAVYCDRPDRMVEAVAQLA